MKYIPAENLPHVSPQMLVRDALDRFFIVHNFKKEEYTASTFTIGIGRMQLRLPNTRARQKAIPLHDLHHILTGYGTDWVGEAENGAWELRAGCNSFTVYLLNVAAVLPGLFISPHRVWRAFRAAKGKHTLYVAAIPYESLLQLTIQELREKLSIPARGLN